MAQAEIIVTAGVSLEIITEGAAPVDVTGGSSVVVEIATEGTQGPAGASGPMAAPFVQSWVSPESSWTVNHNLGRSPAAVRVLTPGGVQIEPDIIETSANQVIVSFSDPQAGRVLVF